MPREMHPLDTAADELFQWLKTEPAVLAEAFRGGYRTPFSAPLSERQKLGYYQRKMYNLRPDGSINYDSPNETGREQLIKMLGIEGYTQVSAAVLREKDSVGSIPDMSGSPPGVAPPEPPGVAPPEVPAGTGY